MLHEKRPPRLVVTMNGGKAVQKSYLPFRGLSAWFSSSVRPSMAKKWDEFGGCLSTEDKADFLFSDSSYSVDTVRIYDTQPSVTVFQSAWITEVVRKQCTVHDIPLGQYLVLPHHLIQVCVDGDPFKTPEPATLMELHREGLSEDSEREGGGGEGTGLSRLLARREKRKEAGLNESRTWLKNSRESHTLGSLDVGSLGGGVTSGGVREGGVKDVFAMWEHLMKHAETKIFSNIQHVNSFKILDQKLMDFDPSLTHFTMRRKMILIDTKHTRSDTD